MPQTFGKYVEPFAGSACLFFALRPPRAVLGDFNAELIHAYRMVLRHPRRVARGVASLEGTSAVYYAIRSIDPEGLDDIPRAVRFVYLNRYCFNGVYRTNRLSQFNVPMGTRPGQPPNEAEFYRGAVALRAAELVQDDFSSTLLRAGCGDVAYLDPPYSTATRHGYGEYGYGAFSGTDVPRLIEAVEATARRGVSIVLSYTRNEGLLDRLKHWSVIEIDVLRQVGPGATRTRPTTEILASNTHDLRDLLQPVRR